MATINRRQCNDGRVTYKVMIRTQGEQIVKSFMDENHAIAYAYYKENLIKSMKNFEVDVDETISIGDVLDIKIRNMDPSKKREIADYLTTKKKVLEFFTPMYMVNMTMSRMQVGDWKALVDHLRERTVYRGAKTASSARKMSVGSIKKVLAHCSAAINFVRSQGINIENHPQFLINTYLKTLT